MGEIIMLNGSQPDKQSKFNTYATITSSLATVHLRAIECINNFLLIIVDNVEDKWWFTQHREDDQQTWAFLFELSDQITGKGIWLEGDVLGVYNTMRVKVIGALGMIARRQNVINDNKFLMLYMTYANKDFDYDEPVFVQGGYLPLLESMVDAVRKM
ncbi:12690_t:CDS:2, partial [Cetraspora pellucida]